MGRKTNSISLRLKKTNKDYIHCMYGDILYSHIFKNSLKMQKTYIDIFKTIDIPCPQLSLTGGYKKLNLYVLYLDPRSRAFLSEKYNIKTRFYKKTNVLKNIPKNTNFENKMSNILKKAGELLRESAHLSIFGGVTVEGGTISSIKKKISTKKHGLHFTRSQFHPNLFLDIEKKERSFENSYIHNGALGISSLKTLGYKQNFKSTNYDDIHTSGVKKNGGHGFLQKYLQNRFLETDFSTRKNILSTYTHLQNCYPSRFFVEKDICSAFLKVDVNRFFFEFYKYGAFLGLASLIKNKHIFFGQNSKCFPVKFKTSLLYKTPPFKILNTYRKNIDSKILDPFYIKNLCNSLKKGWGNRVSNTFIKSTNEKACALFLAHYVSYFLERKVLFRHIKQQLSISLSSFPLYKKRKKRGLDTYALRFYRCAQKLTLPVGIRICCSGRVGSRSKKAQRSRKDTYMWGETGLHVFSNMLDFAKTYAETSFGTVGIKVWVCYRKVS